MKTSIVLAALVACALAAPVASAQDKTLAAEPAMRLGMDNQMSRSGQVGGMAMSGPKNAPGGTIIQRQEMMEWRMDMMQMMMAQTMQHDQMMESLPAK